MTRSYRTPTQQIIERGAISKLRLKLVESGERQYVIAARANISPSRVSEYAMGQRSIPSHHLVALAKVLKCAPADLIGEYGVSRET